MSDISKIQFNSTLYDIVDEVGRANILSPIINVTAPAGTTITATLGSTTITAVGTDPYVLTVPTTGEWTVHAVNGSDSKDYYVEVTAPRLYSVEVRFLPEMKALNDTTWEEISIISDAGLGASYWSVGDRKAVALSGTVKALTFNGTYYAFIIGFDHNASKEGSNRIHFQFGKTALTGGTDICFTDSYYGSTSGGFHMNTTNTNSGGWNNSDMRKNVCGTSLSSYSGTFIAVIPAALRAVLKSVTKYTNNTGDSTAASAVTATTDYIFLLSEYEVFGSTTYANSTEATYQAQYAYYSAGNSKIKYQHGSTSSAARWWLRSPRVSTSANFLYVYTNGTVNAANAAISRSFAPGFCV